MWQNSFTSQFDQFDEDFFTEGYLTPEDLDDVDLSGITTTRWNNFYVDGDTVCDPEVNQAAWPSIGTTLDDSSLNHHNIIGASNNDDFMSALLASLKSGIECPMYKEDHHKDLQALIEELMEKDMELMEKDLLLMEKDVELEGLIGEI